MSDIRDILNNRKSKTIIRGNSCIPLLKSQDPFSYAEKIFRVYINSAHGLDKVSVIDPYISPLDLDHLTTLFGGNAEMELDIISKFESSEKDDGKVERIKMIFNRREFLLDNGLFADISLTQSLESMHDRYFLFWRNDNLIGAFSIGGSINQRFMKHISIIEIRDSYFLNSLKSFYSKLKTNKKEFS